MQTRGWFLTVVLKGKAFGGQGFGLHTFPAGRRPRYFAKRLKLQHPSTTFPKLCTVNVTRFTNLLMET